MTSTSQPCAWSPRPSSPMTISAPPATSSPKRLHTSATRRPVLPLLVSCVVRCCVAATLTGWARCSWVPEDSTHWSAPEARHRAITVMRDSQVRHLSNRPAGTGGGLLCYPAPDHDGNGPARRAGAVPALAPPAPARPGHSGARRGLAGRRPRLVDPGRLHQLPERRHVAPSGPLAAERLLAAPGPADAVPAPAVADHRAAAPDGPRCGRDD